MAALVRGDIRVMSKGAQDWVARTDILLQTLQELIIRPKYGTRGVLEYDGYITPSTINTLGTVTGKGICYGGAVICVGGASQKADTVGSQVDGGLQYFCPAMEDCNKYSLLAQHGATWQLECYDDVNFYYAGSLGFGITFETSFSILYKENAGNIAYVSAKIMYAVL